MQLREKDWETKQEMDCSVCEGEKIMEEERLNGRERRRKRNVLTGKVSTSRGGGATRWARWERWDVGGR